MRRAGRLAGHRGSALTMDRFEKSLRKSEAQRRLAARRRRAGLLRGRVVTVSLIGFVLLWGVVFTQMATGNDPVLGRRQATTARPREADGRNDRGQASGAIAPAAESIETADPQELEAEELEAEEIEAEEAEAAEFEAEAAEPELETEAEPESEFFEPEPVETAQS
jgi:hypothetical protein